MRELRVAALELRKIKKKKHKLENKSKPRFRVNRIPEAGVKDPLSWAQDDLELGGWVSVSQTDFMGQGVSPHGVRGMD